MSSVLYLFLTHLGLGIAGSLLLVGRDAGAQFFRFNSGLASTLLLIGLAFRQEPTASGSFDFDAVGFGALLVSTGALLIYWASIGRGLSGLRPYLLWTTFLGGIVSLVAQGVGLSGGEIGFAPALTVVSFLSSAALLGGACTAMILGHWYLVLPSMDVSLLQSIVKFHIGSTVARAVVVAAVVWVALVTWSAPSGAGYDQYVLSIDGVFVWQRVLFGLASPGLLSYLTWETAKIRSTQSATGILYVDFFTVVVGEVLAKYLLLSTMVPL